MKDKVQLQQTRANGNSARSNGKYQMHTQKQRINGQHQQKNHHHNRPPNNSQGVYQAQYNHPSTKLKTETSTPSINQQQYIQIMQLDFQATIRSYEIKLKNLNEEYRKNKQQMQIKLKQLFQEKNHWQNIAMRYSENGNACKQPQPNETIKQRDKINKLENEKNMILEQKQQISKQLKMISHQNAQLKQKISQLTKIDNKNNKYSSQPRISRSLTPPPVRTQQPHKNNNNQYVNGLGLGSQKQFEVMKGSCQKMKNLINDLNRELMCSKMGELNAKYSKQSGIGSIHIPSRIAVHKQSASGYLSFNHHKKNR